MIIDLHSDTIYRIWKDGGNLIRNDYSIDKAKLEKGDVLFQCFALFVPMYENVPESKRALSPWQILSELHSVFAEKTAEAGIDDKAVLTTEEGASIEGDISRLQTLKDWGVRIFGLTWNYENELGYPNSHDENVMGKGLKERGIEAVKECGRLGIAVDVSHLSDGGFWDVLRYAEGPVLATHSNARSIADVPRNLSDDSLRALADKGGVAGLNLCPAFLDVSFSTDDSNAMSRVSDAARHVMHIWKTAGEDILALGSDFDGIEGNLEISSPDRFYLLSDELEMQGMPISIIEKLFYRNAQRVLSL